MEQLNALEAAVLAKLVEGDHPVFVTLREQLIKVEVAKRTLTGVGFFTELRVSPTVPRVAPKRSIRFGDVLADVPGLQHGAGFVLYVDDGLVTSLEGYSFDERWPEAVEGFSLRFVKPDRDLSSLEDSGR